MRKIFWNTKVPNVSLVDHVEEGLRIVTLLGVVFVPSRVYLREIPRCFFPQALWPCVVFS